MKRYIEQLIEDLDAVAKNPPQPTYIESPPHLEDVPEISELALVPFKPISEWTGISFEVFPEEYQLTVKQCQQVLDAIFRLFEAMNIELVDSAAKIMPPKDLYFILTMNWDNDIQYLPNAGFDLELCTGDPETCPYGEEYCTCGEDWEEEDHNNLHERFNKVIPEIAKAINSGNTCFLNMDTLEIETTKIQSGNNLDLSNFMNKKWENCCKINSKDSEEVFNTIKFFLFGIENDELRIKLSDAIEKENASETFNSIIKKTDLFEEWLTYEKACTQTYVRKEIWKSINNIPWSEPEYLNGIFNDNSEKIDPQSVPIPGLCIICKLYQNDNKEENMLCNLNRYDQRNDSDFKCEMFEGI